MKITKTTKIVFTEEDKKSAQHFRLEILRPMCAIVRNDCFKCPIKHCSDLEDFLCEIQSKDCLEISDKEVE